MEKKPYCQVKYIVKIGNLQLSIKIKDYPHFLDSLFYI
jgi:hypothetical protein